MGKATSARVLRISTIRLDFQPAENLIPDTVQMYVERFKRGGKCSPVRVRFDGTSYWLEDGFHRLEAVRSLGRKTIAAKVIPGTLADMELHFKDYLKALRAQLRVERAGHALETRKIRAAQSPRR